MIWISDEVRTCVEKPLTNGLPGRVFITQSNALWCIKYWFEKESDRRRAKGIIESSDIGIIADWLTRHGYRMC